MEIGTRKEKQSLQYIFVIFSTLLNVILAKDCSVSWHLTTVPIFYGVDIQLKCMATGSSDCFGSRIFKWIGGPEKEVISFDIRVFDRKKYNVIHDKGNYLLVIKNVTATDLDVSYACHCGFYNSTSILKNVSTTYPEDKGKTQNVSSIAGLVAGGAITCVLAISIGYILYKRRNRNKIVKAGSNEAGTHETLIMVNPRIAQRI